ncbi:RNA polymerase sigma factor [Pedobacter caeni]|uniref:RNA polymerase sigma-70 factor, ECF subfamily n=1 Tax=Pedobacter caeni TaxID=288992 RepID=A0A1M5AHS4_9SPHI|nr:RNA polymerase sigma-70 factor [Pedobacter caeni]SHF29697.1 RNA polymerase sigma-70 factor, ECF subfamily [Pedobacter caeni]
MTIQHRLSDQELVALLKKGNQDAFTEIYDRYWRIMYGHVYKMLLDEEESKDVIQELFSALWINSDRVPDQLNLSGYLYVMAKNKVLNLIRKNKFQTAYLNSLSGFITEASTATMDQLNERDLAAAIEKEIQGLPPRMKEVFELSRKENLTYKEIAERLGTSEETVKKQMHNSIRSIKHRLKESGGAAVLLLTFLR